jgi:hypothetical protein
MSPSADGANRSLAEGNSVIFGRADGHARAMNTVGNERYIRNILPKIFPCKCPTQAHPHD